ncbi:maleylpyruvate isomerase family mycothiol-dependent enzyme [Pseudofrankia inefficax]|uniref:Mycothiol-dependent maleylpyruvate isomerase metal-binding domain-containing protein n=1 Tax=Pseudofrankia inefficax (strain DSM 45817 / CECT 9037 / DDB 130130 / EuI1c) TaxID=298654 RepID=E3J1M2_PSEI1|nr:maleylpyruvate isomerase family mycothiol-dependent enzyme [Pseudofrankia inefficax]ADP81690.1 protein of unknown function DUF1503 [Pseudofrankia inefficax]
MDHAAALVEQNDLFADLLGDADLATPVPTCPGWDLTQLMRHVGRGHRWAAAMVEARAVDIIDPRTVAGGKPPADGAVAWLRESPALLLDAVAVDPDAPVWTFTGPRPAHWWVRRRLYEAVVHRVDAALALGTGYTVEPALAADGVSEWLGLLAARPDGTALRDGATLHLHATDGGLGSDGEWTVRGGPGGITWDHGHGKGDTAVRAAAADLLLALLRRLPADDGSLEIVGDDGLWTGWLANTAF